ncbi:pyridoxamine 5'-phosphate oxidase family protein [Nonomuraea aridisoli]|uniref:Uncharacterized protein n=1 Tax=Nonomuraea aridisoli TaxID=2070368 RepID=A0A2W2FES3_9ACTN|nr:pyridoxamine 5'-phosphate oxidase family protein [Nonomuraea aridisoli]PZG13954.1 hypothetical protein C1J01_28385 [Nonomuraea aridisoli]
MTFTDEEIAYLRSQPLARLATLSPGGQPDVVPVAYAPVTPTVSWSWNLAGEPVGDTWYAARRAEHG